MSSQGACWNPFRCQLPSLSGHLLVVAHGSKFLLRSLEAEGTTWQLVALGPGEVPVSLDPENLLDGGLFGLAAAVMHHMLPRRALPPGGRTRPPSPDRVR